MKHSSRLLASSLGSLFTVAALVACVGGPGALPGDGEQNPDVEKGAASKSSSSQNGSSSTGSSQGGGSTGSVGSSGAVAVDAATLPPAQQTTISAAEFSRACSSDTDCVLVFQGSVCQQCQCPNGAIATSDQGQYNSTLAQRAAACPPNGADPQCQPCSTSFAATCSASKQCTLGVAKKDGG